MAGIAPGTTVLERYVVVKHLLGTRITDLYRARNTSNDEEVVLKALRRGVDSVVAQRFEREARMMSVIMHPNVVQLQTYGTVDGRPCLVMESVDGERLDRVIGREGAIAWPEAVKWMLGLLSGLEAVHAARVVHRDIAPTNIVITRDGKTKLTSLDLATMTGGASSVTTGGEVLGIPHYIAPERALQAKQATAQSDVYSAGATLYHMVSGRVPFAAANFPELAKAFATPPRPPDAPPGFPPIPASIQDAIAAAIETDPSKRTRSARQFASALRVALREEGAAARASARRTGGPREGGGAQGASGRGDRRRRTSTRLKTVARPPGAQRTAGERPPSQPPRGIEPAGTRLANPRPPRVAAERPPAPAPPAPRSAAVTTGGSPLDLGQVKLPPEAELGLELAEEPTGAPELVQEGGYMVDPLMGYGAYGEGPPDDATHIPGASPVLAPDIPGGSPRLGDVSLELELGAPSPSTSDATPWGGGSLELDVDDDELRDAGIPWAASDGVGSPAAPAVGDGFPGPTASDSIPSSYAFTQASAEMQVEAVDEEAADASALEREFTPGSSPFGARPHSSRGSQTSAPVLGLRSSRSTGPHRTMADRAPTLPPGVHEAGQRAQATATGSSPYAMPRRETPSSMYAARPPKASTEPSLTPAPLGGSSQIAHRSPDSGTAAPAPPPSPPADDDLPIDYSGPDPSATPDPQRNKRFSTGSSTLRQAAVVRAEMDMPEDVELPPLRKLFAVLVCRAVEPAPPATKVGMWLETQLRGRGGVRILSSEVFFIVLNADNPEHGERLASVILGALSKAFGKDVLVQWKLAEGANLEDALRPSAAVPPIVEDLLASLG